MQYDFYTSSEASQISGCSRRQLQYWRDKGVVVPTVNPSGKGRNVYYSLTELIALTVMNYLLSLGLSFELSVKILQMLKDRETWMFTESLRYDEYQRWMIHLTLDDYSPAIVNFDWTGGSSYGDTMLRTIDDGGGLIALTSERIYERLKNGMKKFGREITPYSL